jgi:hypothetical protein
MNGRLKEESDHQGFKNDNLNRQSDGFADIINKDSVNNG